MTFPQTLELVKERQEDHELYPTTDEIIARMLRDDDEAARELDIPLATVRKLGNAAFRLEASTLKLVNS